MQTHAPRGRTIITTLVLYGVVLLILAAAEVAERLHWLP